MIINLSKTTPCRESIVIFLIELSFPSLNVHLLHLQGLLISTQATVRHCKTTHQFEGYWVLITRNYAACIGNLLIQL